MPLLPCKSVFLTLLEIAWNTFGLAPTVVHCSETITLDQLYDDILVPKAGEGRSDASAPDPDSKVYQVGFSPLFICLLGGLRMALNILPALFPACVTVCLYARIPLVSLWTSVSLYRRYMYQLGAVLIAPQSQ